MAPKTLEQTVELRQVGEQVFENIHYPVWSWPGTSVFPGGTLIVHATSAAYKTIGSDFAIDSVQAHFLSGPDPNLSLQYTVSNLSDGGRFATRVVVAEQKGKVVLHVTCSFVRASAMTGPSMVHEVKRQSKKTIESITLDDLELGTNEHGPYMKFQRLPLEHIGPPSTAGSPSPTSQVYISGAAISPTITSSSPQIHALGIIGLSDYHVLDAAPTLQNLTFSLPKINDASRKRTPQSFKLYTSLNHTIHFAKHEGFRADDLCYIEVTSSWANRRRAEMHSRIFDREGGLIASCVQEAYYVLKEESTRSKI